MNAPKTITVVLTYDNVAALVVIFVFTLFGVIYMWKLLTRSRCNCSLCSGKYQFAFALSSGAFGKVMVVEKTATEEVVVLKQIAVADMNEANFAQREARQLQSLSHPNIVKYIDDFIHVTKFSGFDPSYFICLVMEYCQHGDLMQRIKAERVRVGLPPPDESRFSKKSETKPNWNAFVPEGNSIPLGHEQSKPLKRKRTRSRKQNYTRAPKESMYKSGSHRMVVDTENDPRGFSEERVLTWFCEIASALRYIHSRSVIHRDLKSGNIFVSENESLRIGDFGLARNIGHGLSTARSQEGTDSYMAPEMLFGKPYTQKVDVWSLGCILYEMCTFTFMWELPGLLGVQVSASKDEIEEIRRALPSKYSKELSTLLGRLLHPEPSYRPSIEKVLRKKFLRKYR